jgi:hypothetical protein
MARVDQGNNLTTVLQQPGAKFQEDGYGLATGSIVFKAAITASVGSTINRGSACPQGAFNYCKAHKYSVSFESLGIATYTVDYVGIVPSFGTSTNPQITGSQGLTSENITTHPNFFEVYTAGGFSGTAIAGVGPSPGSKNTPNFQAVAGTNPTEYEGNNGATFELATGRKFLGFKKSQFENFYGKSNYLAPQCSLSGVFYTSSSALVINLRNAVGKTSGDGSFASKDLVPTYMGTAFTVSGKNQLLLSQVSFEDFGLLYKVQYELRFNREGYVASVYAAA